MTELLLVRHAETAPNRDRRLLGRFDPPLTERGHEQALALAGAVAAYGPGAIVTSPMARTRETAAALAAACGLDVTDDDRLLEIDYGEFDGIPVGELPPEAVRAMRDDPAYAPAGGESMQSVMERIGSWCHERLSAADDAVVVAVTHMSPIKAAVAWALGVPPNLGFRTYVAVASITRLGGAPGAPVLLSCNETAHLRVAGEVSRGG